MDEMSFAVTVTVEGGQWIVHQFTDEFDDAEVPVNAVRDVRSESAAFAMVCVDDEYFAIVRPGPWTTQVFLSDVTMAVDDDYAAGLADMGQIRVPDIDPSDLDDIDGYPDGDFEILVDLGVSEEVLSVLSENMSMDPHEALFRIADDLGFYDELTAEVGY